MDGQWHMVIYSVPETDRALREKLRKPTTKVGKIDKKALRADVAARLEAAP